MKRTHALRHTPALRPLSDDTLAAVSGAGAPSVSEIVVTKSSDTASSKLLQACCSGRHFDAAKIVV